MNPKITFAGRVATDTIYTHGDANTLKSIFKVEKPIIGALHLLPLIGGKERIPYKDILECALADLKALEQGGVDGVIVENNYDLPHRIVVRPETVALMSKICKKLRANTSLPVGISVLWNDYKAAISIAKTADGSFVRIPAFVDEVMTSFGRVSPVAASAIRYRKRIHAENVKIFSDIHVKHAHMLSKKSIAESAAQAEKMRSDGIIVTGTWTGDPPSISDLKKVSTSTSLPVIIGSGFSQKEVGLLKFADAVIVSTSLKTGTPSAKQRNLKPYTARIDRSKVAALMRKVKEFRKNGGNL